MTQVTEYERADIRGDSGVFRDKGNWGVDPGHPDFNPAQKDIGNGVVDARFAFVAADVFAQLYGLEIVVTPGTYLIGSNLTITSRLRLIPGAVLVPASGVTITPNGNSEVLPNWWGAAGNGTTDDTTALTRAFASGRPVAGALGALYRVASTIVIPAGDITIRDLRLRPDAAITGNGCLSHAVTTKATTTLTTAATRVGDRVIDVVSTTGMAAGDILRISSNQDWPYSNQGFIKKGETQRIEVVLSATQLRLKMPLFCAYTIASETVTLVAYEDYRLRIDGLEIEYPTPVDKYGCGFSYFADGIINNLRIKNCGQVGASLGGLVNTVVSGGSLEDNYLTGYGYGIQLVECTQTIITGFVGSRNRHCIDISGGVPSHACRITSCVVIGHPDEGSCLSAHGSANACAFENNTCIGAIIGISPAGPNMLIAGNTFVGCLYSVIVGAPGFQVLNNHVAAQPKANSANPDAINNNFVTIQLGDGTVVEADLWYSGLPNTIAGNSGTLIGACIYIQAAIAELKYTNISNNHFAFENGGGNVAFIESGHAGTPLVVHSSCRFDNNHMRNVNGAFQNLRNVTWANPGIGTTTTNPGATSAVGHIGVNDSTVLTNGQAFTFTVPAGVVLFTVVDNSSAKAGVFFADLAAATVSILSDPSSYFENSSTPTAGKVGVYKSAGVSVISVKNAVGSTRTLGICVLGAAVSATSTPA